MEKFKMAVTLKALVAATLAGSHIFAAPIELAKLNKDHFEQNKNMKEGNKFATRATEAGITFEQSGEAEQPKPKLSFSLDDGVEMPAAKRGGRQGDTYPFDAMSVGQSFFVPQEAGKPDIAKTMASTCSSANARYAVGTGEFETVKVKEYQTDAEGKKVKGDDGKSVVTGERTEQKEKMRFTRKFETRAVEGGARVWRTA